MKTGLLAFLTVFSSLSFPHTAAAQASGDPFADGTIPQSAEAEVCPLAPNPENLLPSRLCLEPIDEAEPIPAPRPNVNEVQ